ncbi:PDR/VanB family oxidoreductase [Asticcacaulis sp. ZE23SCel15]|uniref:PDR/VanB family oxidoreductase n=1 Tax=Asticcacaulis sp. ZE23SCel15 TaxID=3059027 RepID=UPI00265F74F7|nr:PDR/VanB family oxidoreductase [Asticcacaulis sp. ZE23SCel15]WKL57115.1 PDR/VanB family oxidoreductase [Asticcacaulis sp. ZE23SCel15]
MSETHLRVRVHDLTEVGQSGEAGCVRILDLRAEEGSDLPPFEAGAHIDIVAREGLIRQYSLLNAPSECHRYVVAIALDAQSRGGSKHFHDWVELDDVLTISAPRCHFHLNEDSPYTVLIAGGIGVTPVWSMAQRLLALGKPFEFHYGARARSQAALLTEIEATLGAAGVRFEVRFEDNGGARLNLTDIFEAAPDGAHFYACGPSGMLDAYIAAGAARGPDYVHYERFSGVEAAATEGGFEVELARTGGCYEVPSGLTILEALKTHGINVPHSCAEGICGACECGVLSGIPDHRDSVLTDAEKAANTTMMVCCSGSRSPKLVLDL